MREHRLAGAVGVDVRRLAVDREFARCHEMDQPQFVLGVSETGVVRDKLPLLVEFALEVSDPRDPMVMVLNTQRLASLLRGEPLEAAAA